MSDTNGTAGTRQVHPDPGLRTQVVEVGHPCVGPRGGAAAARNERSLCYVRRRDGRSDSASIGAGDSPARG